MYLQSSTFANLTYKEIQEKKSLTCSLSSRVKLQVLLHFLKSTDIELISPVCLNESLVRALALEKLLFNKGEIKLMIRRARVLSSQLLKSVNVKCSFACLEFVKNFCTIFVHYGKESNKFSR